MKAKIRKQPPQDVISSGWEGTSAPLRIRALRKQLKRTNGHSPDVGHLHFMPESVDLSNPADVAAYCDEIERRGLRLKLLIIDTLNRSVGAADENSTADMSKVLANLEYIKDRLACTVMPVHHSRKDGAAMRGSTVTLGAADTVIRVVRTGKGRIRLVCEKQRDAAPFDPINLRFHETSFKDGHTSGYLVRDDAVQQLRAKVEGAQGREAEALAVLSKAGAKGLSRAEWERGASFSGGTFKRAVSLLLEQARVERVQVGREARYVTKEVER